MSLEQHSHLTPLGPMTSSWTTEGLYSLEWTDTVPADTSETECCRHLQDLLDNYFETGQADFTRLELDQEDWSPFHSRVYDQCRRIPSGATITYKELASRAGNSGASRAVGAAMSRNRTLLVIPCHRVISVGGSLRGFSAPGGLQTKQFLLDLENRTRDAACVTT